MDIPRIGIDMLEPRARTWSQRLRLRVCGGEPAARLGWLRRLLRRTSAEKLLRESRQLFISREQALQMFGRPMSVSYEQFVQDLQAAHYSSQRRKLLDTFKATQGLRPKHKARGGTLTPSGARVYCDPRLPYRRKG